MEWRTNVSERSGDRSAYRLCRCETTAGTARDRGAAWQGLSQLLHRTSLPKRAGRLPTRERERGLAETGRAPGKYQGHPGQHHRFADGEVADGDCPDPRGRKAFRRGAKGSDEDAAPGAVGVTGGGKDGGDACDGRFGGGSLRSDRGRGAKFDGAALRQARAQG